MTVIAVVPAFNRGGLIAATVAALREVDDVQEVVVVDDGSTDDTASRAATAGARVIRLENNVGKGGAVAAGLAAVGKPDVVLLIDSDTAETAAAAAVLIEPVMAGALDMSIAVLPSAGTRGGFGLVRDVAANGLKRATGQEFAAPLSGQRAVRWSTISGLDLAPRFGLEVGLTIDVIAAGGRVGEVEADFDHQHTGRTIAGFRHRFGQGLDLVRVLRSRIGGAATIRVVLGSLWKRVRR